MPLSDRVSIRRTPPGHGPGRVAPIRPWPTRRLRAAIFVTVATLPIGCGDSIGPPGPALETTPLPDPVAGPETEGENVVLLWNRTLLEAISHGTLGPPMVARALSVVHTAMFNAWAAYDDVAVATRPGSPLRRPTEERTPANRSEAISYAAYRTLVDLFPPQKERFRSRMAGLGHDPEDATTDPSRAAGVGNLAAQLMLDFCHDDGANQLGDLGPAGVPYSDYTGYHPVNTLTEVFDPNRWQPLTHPNAAGTAMVEQVFLGAHWDRVAPFALASPDQFRPPPPKAFPHGLYREQAQELIRMSAGLTDRDKMIVEYWADGPNTVLPPGHFNLFARFVSVRDGHTMDDDVKLFFILGNAVHDAAIAAWEAKIHYDYVRPITAIRYLKRGQKIRAWAGPGMGTRVIVGEDWRPYQPDWFPTPPFSEYVSGHSTFSAAGAEVLRRFTGSDLFGGSVTLDQGPVGVEPGVPAQPITLAWETFSAAADEAGLSRRLGGIHFRDGDLEGRHMGRAVAAVVWDRALEHIQGTAAVILATPHPEP
jgi:hypothetical protein